MTNERAQKILDGFDKKYPDYVRPSEDIKKAAKNAEINTDGMSDDAIKAALNDVIDNL